MGVETRGKRRRRLEEEQELVVDRISGLPDGVLGDIVSLLPTKDGARTQLLSSRWRHLWRAAPLNLELHGNPWQRTPADEISGILSSHPGPSRRFYIDYGSLVCLDHSSYYSPSATEVLDGWLRSPAMDGLKELEILFDPTLLRWGTPLLPLPPSVFRFSSTLTVASFEACVLPDCGEYNASRGLQWPLLKKLTLSIVTISESSLHALLAGCSAIDSLLLQENNGFSRLRIVSPSLRSIGVSSLPGPGLDDDDTVLEQLVVEDAPCLERLLFSEGLGMNISVISAPRLNVLGELQDDSHKLQFGTSALQVQGSTVASLTAVVPSVRVLALSRMKPCLDAVINLMKCFPHLEKLHIEITHVGEENKPYDKYQDHANTLDIRLRNIVLAYFYDRKSHIEFAKFLILNASMLESMTLQLKFGRVGDNAWIREQRRLLQVEKRASRGARFDFVSRIGSFSLPVDKQVHDLSILDPFQRIH